MSGPDVEQVVGTNAGGAVSSATAAVPTRVVVSAAEDGHGTPRMAAMSFKGASCTSISLNFESNQVISSSVMAVAEREITGIDSSGAICYMPDTISLRNRCGGYNQQARR